MIQFTIIKRYGAFKKNKESINDEIDRDLKLE